MSLMEELDKSGIQIMLKCLKSLGETGLRPPLGGAQAHTNRVLATYLKNNFLVS